MTAFFQNAFLNFWLKWVAVSSVLDYSYCWNHYKIDRLDSYIAVDTCIVKINLDFQRNALKIHVNIS